MNDSALDGNTSQLESSMVAVSEEDQELLDSLGSIGEEMEQDEDVSELVLNNDGSVGEGLLSVSYHIVFSPSYQVPVLYFNAFTAGGAPLKLEEIYHALVPPEWRETVRNSGLNGGISQQDHPVLNVPYYYMHPCETVSLMETVLRANPDQLSSQEAFLNTYIATWLSFTGQAIGLSLPLDLVK
ncbi:E2-like conjugating enzyme atg10 [Podila epigama]|nr:E2-like conjugating enzyme atg10 [Podila epigama]